MSAKTVKIALLTALPLLGLAGSGYAEPQPVVIPLHSFSAATADYVDGNQSIGLTAADQTIRSLTLDVPRAGLVIANASGYFKWEVANRESAGRCAITQDSSVSIDHLIIAGGAAGTNLAAEYLPFAGTRAFYVDSGTNTFNVVCNAYLGADNDITVKDVNMNVVFYDVPGLAAPRTATENSAAEDECLTPAGAACD